MILFIIITHVHGIDVQRRPLIFDTPDFHLNELTASWYWCDGHLPCLVYFTCFCKNFFWYSFDIWKKIFFLQCIIVHFWIFFFLNYFCLNPVKNTSCHQRFNSKITFFCRMIYSPQVEFKHIQHSVFTIKQQLFHFLSVPFYLLWLWIFWYFFVFYH